VAVQFPAFCPYCGLIFDSRFAFGGTVVLQGNREDCPRCGKWAELPDGTFDVVGNTVHVLAASKLTLERLQRLQAILDAANTGALSDEAAAEAIAAEAPELKPLLTKLRPKMGRALIILLWATVQILATQALAEHRDHAATAKDVENAVQQAIQLCKTQGGH